MAGEAFPRNKSGKQKDADRAEYLGFTRVQVWGTLFLVYTAAFFLMFNYRYLDDLARQRMGTLGMRLLEESTGSYTAFVLLPLVLWWAGFYVVRPVRWIQTVALHISGAVGFSAAHTTLMAMSRWLIAPVVGLGSYDYGIMRFRYPMEFSVDFLFYTITVATFYLFERLRIAQAQQLAAAELQTKLAEAQLENLRLQLQPHFLFNTLNTISSVMYEDVRAADAMVTQLSELLRLTLRASRTHEIPLADELRITHLYLDLMQKRFENKLRVTYSVESILHDSLVPQLILQPLLENSLRHGMKPGGAAMEITVAAQRENGSLVLKVSDTGVGFGPENPDVV